MLKIECGSFVGQTLRNEPGKVVHPLSSPSPTIGSWLVATKLHPPLVRSDTIRRPRLEDALRQSVSTLPLTLLSAPAGYGKTTMLATLPHLLPGVPLAWVTLDAEDNDPIRFIGLLATAFGRLHPDCGRSVWPLLAGGADDVTGLKRLMGALLNDLFTCLPGLAVLVLDDLHVITDPWIYVALEYLLDHQPPQLRLALGTRHDPPLRLARLAARRQLAEVRRADLGFRPDEAAALLNDTLGLSLPADAVASLQERTEGWPAGLCLLAGPLGRLGSDADRTEFLAAVVQSERYAMDFLAEEVLRDLPEDLRLFLLQTSVLAELTPAACRAVTGRADSADVLEGLYRQNLAIASIAAGEGSEGEPVYRYHALFTRLLLRRLEAERPEEVADLHRRAAEAQKTPGRAIAHYLTAGLWDQAARVMGQSGTELLHFGMSETLRAWYAALPLETQAAHPRLTVLMARREVSRGDYAAAGRLLAHARDAFAANGDAVGEADAVTSLITLTIQNDNRSAAATLIEQAMSLPPTPMGQAAALLARAWLRLGDGDWAGISADVEAALAIPLAARSVPAHIIVVTYACAPLLGAPGCVDLLERYLTAVGPLSPRESPMRLGADEWAAWTLLLRGRTSEALERAEAAEALRQRLLGVLPVLGNDAPLLLAVLHTARGDRAAAGRAVETLQQRLERAPRSRQPFYLHAAGRSLALLGRREEAQAVGRRLAAMPGDLPLVQYLQHHLTGLLALLDGHHAEAAGPLEAAAEAEAGLPIARAAGSARLLQARLLLEQGRAAEGVSLLGPLLAEWAEAGVPGAALLDGPAGLPALQAAARQGHGGAAAVRRLFPEATPAASPGAPLTEALTQREQDVLRLIVAGRTNRQIGEELYITEETVKTHVVRILRKLDVTSRTQAAIRGRELGF